jgi:hypothetical protein
MIVSQAVQETLRDCLMQPAVRPMDRMRVTNITRLTLIKCRRNPVGQTDLGLNCFRRIDDASPIIDPCHP